MTSQVMHRYKRQSACKGQSLCKVYSHKKCAYKPRRIGHGKSVNAAEVCLCLSQRFLYNSVY